jgi:hypothetical protein
MRSAHDTSAGWRSRTGNGYAQFGSYLDAGGRPMAIVRILFLVLWTMHGTAHLAGVVACWAPQVNVGFKRDEPWILPGDVTLDSALGKLWGFVWLAAAVLILSSSYALVVRADWWVDAALYGSIASLVAILPWAKTVVPGALMSTGLSAMMILILIVPSFQGFVLEFS